MVIIFNTLWKKTKPNIVIVHTKNYGAKPPILKCTCKVALIIGGSNNGFGFSAADQLLYHGAKKVIIADNNAEMGARAVEKLCNTYGKHRAKFFCCNLKNSCHIEAIFSSSYCTDENISIMFNDLDAIQSLPDPQLSHCMDGSKINNTLRLLHKGFKYMCNKKGGQGTNGIIVNCASIMGFVGWPEKPKPIYCCREPVIETTLDIVPEYPVKKTGIRVVSLCPINRAFETIGLPNFPDYTISKESRCPNSSCSPNPSLDKKRLGKGLVHLMAYATTGSVWLLQPPFTLSEIPKLVDYFKPK
ncbi:PREDICTED: uncharacterized protein LOC105363358 [Ceratosolen solmsi marchali]|uniref:Uncharacterized protein LOC105363358 n=1 Tax=Ceratosolen solmsi marchali TaxID=326594 RepID=A0AAJ6YJN8_9HYME|nr:PREDICTED: uncharacterized protein LOC105363358 [Ceratosolen solmsi marchali]